MTELLLVFNSVIKELSSNSIISAAIGSMITLLLTNIFKKREKKKEDLQLYLNSLVSAKDELVFYHLKLQQLSGDAEKIHNSLSLNTALVIPTYSLYPNLLENAKINLNGFNQDPIAIKYIGNCHFELSHIQQRLELLRSELRIENSNLSALIANVEGFKLLVDSNVNEFLDAINEIDKIIKKHTKR